VDWGLQNCNCSVVWLCEWKLWLSISPCRCEVITRHRLACPIVSPCLTTDGCLLTLFISFIDILLLILPTRDFVGVTSSLTIFCALGSRGLVGLFDTTTPALSVKSCKNDSLSVANFLRALSNSKSLSPPAPLGWPLKVVALLLLLSLPLSGTSLIVCIDCMEFRVSSGSLESRLYDSRLLCR